mmetsp:Transcript_19224/g.43734  ORF Transcript_19224/g.43734 Transcript_19224/m.43734 type:complete len:302 (-) Transcript_19224:427-1332(-)
MEGVRVRQEGHLPTEDEGHALGIDVRVQGLEVKNRRQHVVLEQTDCLHEHCHPSVALSVPLGGLAGDEHQRVAIPGTVARPVELLQGAQLNRVAEVRAVALALGDRDLSGRDASSPHGVLDELSLRRPAGSRELSALAVLHGLAGDPDRSPILELVAPTDDEGPGALANDVAVRAVVEGHGAALSGKQGAAATGRVHLRAEQGTDAERQAVLDLAPPDVRGRHVGGDQRRGASRVDVDARPREAHATAYAVRQHGHVPAVDDPCQVHQEVEVHAACIHAGQGAPEHVARHLGIDEGAVALL